MRAELRKLRALPTPRWTAVGVLLVLAATLAGVAYWGIGEDDAALGLGAELPTAVAAIIIGTWMVGVEYGQGTMHRTLSAEPRRLRLLAVKLAAAVGAVTALTVVVFAVCAAGLPALADAHGQDLAAADAARAGAAAVIGNAALASFGVAFAFLTRSMAGALTVAFVYAFVIDSAMSAIPRVGDHTSQSANLVLWEAITQRPGDHDVLLAAAVLAAWIAGFLALGFLRFARRDA